jgi:MOSC domain-containing protein YiiM
MVRAAGGVADRGMLVVSVQVGRPRWMQPTDDGGPWDTRWFSGFVKEPVHGPVMLRRENLDGDGQADLRVHGGPDMAVLVYAAGHYPRWREELGLPGIGPGGFGENLTVEGQDERSVCIGDVYDVGEARVQVSQPRGPCKKISWRWRRADLLRRVEETGRHGWYVRVLREGTIEAGQRLVLVERPHPEWTVRRAADVYRRRKQDREAAAALAACEALASSARAALLPA